MNNTKKKTALGLLGMLFLTFSLVFSLTANTSEARSKYQGEFTGNCYCNIAGTDCACVIVVEKVK